PTPPHCRVPRLCRSRATPIRAPLPPLAPTSAAHPPPTAPPAARRDTRGTTSPFRRVALRSTPLCRAQYRSRLRLPHAARHRRSSRAALPLRQDRHALQHRAQLRSRRSLPASRSFVSLHRCAANRENPRGTPPPHPHRTSRRAPRTLRLQARRVAAAPAPP